MTVPAHAVHYLEIMTPDVEAARRLSGAAYGRHFQEMDPRPGDAFVAHLPGGSLCGIRAPMHPRELPIVRTSLRVTDIKTAVRTAAGLGAQILIENMEIPGHGTIAIYERGGVQQGLWQVLETPPTLPTADFSA